MARSDDRLGQEDANGNPGCSTFHLFGGLGVLEARIGQRN